jgi:hypothetical protein
VEWQILKIFNMNQEVWKFCIIDEGYVDKFEIKMPKDTQLLNVDFDDNNYPCIFGLVYPHKQMETRYFELFGTGQPIHNDMGIERKYIGTFNDGNGEFFGHIFERIN